MSAPRPPSPAVRVLTAAERLAARAVIGAAADDHTHDAAAIVTGVVAPARLGTGTADSMTVLYGDGTWDTLPAAAVADGDKGDVLVSAGGTVWDLDPTVVTAAGRALVDDATAADQRTTLGLGTMATEAASDYVLASGFAEGVDDQVAAMLVAGANITLTYNDAGGTLTIDAAGGGGGGVSDGDKGDITVSGAGTVWEFDPAVVTAAGRALLDDASASAQRTTLGLAAIAASGSASDLVSGTAPTARLGTGTADGTTFLRGDQTWAVPSGGGGGGAWTTVVKTTDEVRISTTTLASDSKLFTGALAVSKIYALRARIFYTTNATPDIKYRLWDFTGIHNYIAVHRRTSLAGGAAGTDNETTHTLAGIPATVALGGGTGVGIIELDAIVSTLDAGRIQFEWAQNFSNVNAATILAGSYLEYMQVN